MGRVFNRCAIRSCGLGRGGRILRSATSIESKHAKQAKFLYLLLESFVLREANIPGCVMVLDESAGTLKNKSIGLILDLVLGSA